MRADCLGFLYVVFCSVYKTVLLSNILNGIRLTHVDSGVQHPVARVSIRTKNTTQINTAIAGYTN
jgi:hypothetical protein